MARSFFAASLLAAVALVGCGTGTTGEVKLGVDVAAVRSAVVSATDPAADSSALVLTRVRVLIDHAKIGYHNDQATGGPAADIGPFVVDLTADEIANGAHREFSLGQLPADTYGGAEIEIQPLEADSTASDATLDDFRAAGASLLVEGTYNGNAFTFAGHFLAEQGTDGDVVVDASTPVSLSLTVDPQGWFLDASGAALDPGDAAQHDALAVAICKTLDTQAQTDAALGGGAAPADSSAPPAGSAPPADSSGAPPSGGKHGGHGGGGKGGGGNMNHCVEQSGG
ncbi:MAG: hypothetical protein U0359_18285 [Byssovorax sp.]